MITRDPSVMMALPGIYVIVQHNGIVAFVEVVGNECHQLKPDTFERDGELAPDGWALGLIAAIAGPLARPDKKVLH